MLLAARLAALGVAVAVLVLMVLPWILALPDGSTRSGEPPGDVNIAKNTRWGQSVDDDPSTSWGTRAPIPKAEIRKREQDLSKPDAEEGSALANAPAEVKRFASIEKGHAIEIEPPKRTRFYRVIVLDAGTLKTGNHLIRLKGITVRDENETCEHRSGESWPCGRRARSALRRLIRGRAVVCDLPPSADRPTFSARCNVAGTDLSHWMVRQGWAKPASENDAALAKARDAAKQAQLGLWRQSE